MNTIFISDAHINAAPDGRDNVQAFTAFLRGIDPSKTGRLIILGDLFDFWYEYNHVVFSGYFDVLRAFADLHDHGVEILFACGNHDFWAGRFMERELGFTIYQDPVTLELDGLRIHFAHGDGINPKDWVYRLFKRFARLSIIIKAFALIHPDWAMGIAQFVSRGSRKMFSPDDPSEGPEVIPLRNYAEKMLASGQADAVVLAHSHYPAHEEFLTPNGKGHYLNTGDWMQGRTYIILENGEFTLVRPEHMP